MKKRKIHECTHHACSKIIQLLMIILPRMVCMILMHRSTHINFTNEGNITSLRNAFCTNNRPVEMFRFFDDECETEWGSNLLLWWNSILNVQFHTDYSTGGSIFYVTLLWWSQLSILHSHAIYERIHHGFRNDKLFQTRGYKIE